MVIFVSLRMAASAEAPSSPMRLPPILQAEKGQDGNGERGGVSMGADRKANTLGWGALQIGDLRLLENSSERGDALGPDVVPGETARGLGGGSERAGACQWAVTQKRTLSKRRRRT